MLLNARYAPIGVSVAPLLTGPGGRGFMHAQLTVDETWAVAAEGEGRFNPSVLLGAGVTLYAAWVGGTMLGVAFGDVIGDLVATGARRRVPGTLPRAVGAAAARTPDGRAPPLLGAGIALALTPFTPAGVPIIAASAACLLGLRASGRRPHEEPRRDRHLDRRGGRRRDHDRDQGARSDAARRQALAAPRDRRRRAARARPARRARRGEHARRRPELVVDARLPGVLAAAVAIKLKAPVLIVVIVAALVTAGVRAIAA